MNVVQQAPAQQPMRQITQYETWSYFVKDMNDAYKCKVAVRAIIVGGLFLLQGLLVMVATVVMARVPPAEAQIYQIFIVFSGLVSIPAFFIVANKLFKLKASWIAWLVHSGEIAWFFTWIPPLSYLPLSLFLPLCLGLALIIFYIIRLNKIKSTPPLLTDQEFDAWVESRARQGLVNTICRLGLENEIRHPAYLLCVRGYVLPGMSNARYYNARDLLSRQGTDGRWRYSINIYTYFYAAEHQIMIFIYDINAMNWGDYREATKEYFYEDVIGATTQDDQDTVFVQGFLYNYRVQRFSLRLCDGFGVTANMRSQPLDPTSNLPTFDVPNSNIDRTIAQLRMLLRSKKGNRV